MKKIIIGISFIVLISVISGCNNGVQNNNQATEGVLYLRDQNDKWSEQIPFAVDYSGEEYQDINVDLSNLPSDFKITQLMLKLTNKNNYRWREIWSMDWLRIGERQKNIL